jgi:hypothetical protein
LRILAALGALAVAGCATAGLSTSSLMDDGYPPARFAGDGTNLVHYLQRPLPGTPCSSSVPAGYQLNGCRLGGTNEVWLPNPCSKEFAGQSFARYACHELGHSNGWPPDHPRP